MEKLEKDPAFARLARTETPAAPAPAEGDALLQLLLPLLMPSSEGPLAEAGMFGDGTGTAQEPASPEGLRGQDGAAPGIGLGGGGLDLLPGAESAQGPYRGMPIFQGQDPQAADPWPWAPRPGAPDGGMNLPGGLLPAPPETGVDLPGGLPLPPDGAGTAPGVPVPSLPRQPPEAGAPMPGPVGDDGSEAPPASTDSDAPPSSGPRGPTPDDANRARGTATAGAEPARSAPADPLTPRPGAAAKQPAPDLADAAPTRGPAGLAPGRGMPALAAAVQEAAPEAGAATSPGGWGGAAAAGGFGQQVSVGLAGLAADSVDARRQAFAGTARSRSDLENLEPVALGALQRRTMQSPGAPAAMQPVVAQIAADMYRLQTARLDQLMASRAADEDGEPPPLDAEEALMRQREIKGVDLGGMWRWDLAPSIGLSPLEETSPMHLAFRAALLTVTMQDPAAVLPLFSREGERDGLRLYVPDPAGSGGLLTRWEAVATGPRAPSSWMAAAEQAFVRAYPEGGAREALQALLGRAAVTEAVVGDQASAKRLWKQLCAANSPRQVPTVLRTLDMEGIPLAAGHAYGVLGTFVRDGAWMVTLCDPLAPAEGHVFAVPFTSIRRSADSLTVSARAA